MFPGCYGDGKPKIESCIACCEPTGRAGKGEDSIYFGDVGPFCESCKDDIQNHVESKQQDEIERLRKLLREAVDWHWVRPRDGWIDDAMWAIREGGA